jgi:hypothetical protein
MADIGDTVGLPHDNIQPLTVALIFIFPVIATVSLALRIYSRTLTRTFASGIELLKTKSGL